MRPKSSTATRHTSPPDQPDPKTELATDAPAAAAAAVRTSLLGGWDLVTVVWSGRPIPKSASGEERGSLLYLDDGTFSLHINATNSRDHVAAHGLFTLKSHGSLIHHTDGSTIVGWRGLSQQYEAVVADNHLVLVAVAVATFGPLARPVWQRTVWER